MKAVNKHLWKSAERNWRESEGAQVSEVVESMVVCTCPGTLAKKPAKHGGWWLRKILVMETKSYSVFVTCEQKK